MKVAYMQTYLINKNPKAMQYIVSSRCVKQLTLTHGFNDRSNDDETKVQDFLFLTANTP